MSCPGTLPITLLTPNPQHHCELPVLGFDLISYLYSRRNMHSEGRGAVQGHTARSLRGARAPGLDVAVSLLGSQYYTADAYVDLVLNTRCVDRDLKMTFSLHTTQKHTPRGIWSKAAGRSGIVSEDYCFPMKDPYCYASQCGTICCIN